MKLKSSFIGRIYVLCTISLGLSQAGCGQAGVDPLALMDQSIPVLESAIPSNWPNLTGVYNNATPYWTFNAFGAINFLAPAAGYVSLISGGSIKIIHSGRFATVVSGLGVINVRQGDYVVTGQAMATFATTGSVTFQVLLDGAPVCPLSFMSTNFRSVFFAGVTGNPCTQ